MCEPQAADYHCFRIEKFVLTKTLWLNKEKIILKICDGKLFSDKNVEYPSLINIQTISANVRTLLKWAICILRKAPHLNYIKIFPVYYELQEYDHC